MLFQILKNRFCSSQDSKEVMDLPYKQVKTVWRLIVFRCDIYTVISIFKTCRENRELSGEESVWRYLCERDCGRVSINSPRLVYRFRHILGGRVLFSREAATYAYPPDSFNPRYIFKCGDFWCATFDGNSKSPGCSLYPRVKDSKHVNRDVLFDPVLKTATSPKGICSTRIDAKRATDWIKQHFDVHNIPNIVYLQHCIRFKANLLPGYMSVPPEENVIRYYLHYSGHLAVQSCSSEDIIDATLEFEGIMVEIPNFYL